VQYTETLHGAQLGRPPPIVARRFVIIQHAEAGVVGIRRVVINIYRDSGRVAGGQAIRPGIGEAIRADIMRVRCIGEGAVGMETYEAGELRLLNPITNIPAITPVGLKHSTPYSNRSLRTN
jgi:hypothetical protein